MRRSIRESEKTYFYLLVPLLIYTVKAIILMRGGKLYGRLALPPPYDDVNYFVDAMGRVRIFFEQGLYGSIQDLIRNPPHAPYPTIAAMFAFLFCGSSVAGPYFMNGLMAALLSALLFRLFRLGALTTVCVCIVLVTTAWFDNLVTIFHPDLMSGFGAAIVAAVLIWQNEIMQHRWHALLVGTAGGFILLIKPTAIGMLTILWTLAFLVGAFLDYREEKSLRRIGVRLVFGALPILAIAGPYFAHELGNIIEYDVRGFVHERKTWMGLVPPDRRAMYYLNAARDSFECWLFVAVGGALGIIVASFYRGDGRTAWRFVGLIFLSLIAYLVPATVEVKDYVFGGVIYGSIAVCLILMIHFLTDRLWLSWPIHRLLRFQLTESGLRITRAAALILIGLFAVTGLADKQGRYSQKVISAQRAEYDGVYPLLKKVLATQQGVSANSTPTLIVYFPCPAPVAPDAFKFHALLDGLDFKRETSPHQSDLQALVDIANRATIIVLPDDEALKLIYPYPVTKLIPSFRTWLDQNTKFKRIGTVRTSLGGTDLFATTSVAVETAPALQSH